MARNTDMTHIPYALVCPTIALVLCGMMHVSAEERPNHDYVLGPNDEIKVEVLDAPEISGKTFRVDNSGSVSMPLVGRFPVSGMNAREVEQALRQKLTKFLLDPAPAITVTELRSQPVSIVGSVKTPGTYQIQGNATLMQLLAQAGGLTPEAGKTIRLTRRFTSGIIPLPNASKDPKAEVSFVDMPSRRLVEGKNATDNIQLQPYDLITVEKAELVYVVGEVEKSGGFLLGEKESISALQALSLAGGLGKMAAPKHTRILREQAGQSSRQEIAVNLQLVLYGESPDIQLHANDILFVPTNTPRKVALRIIEAAIQTGSGIAIFGTAR